MFKCKVCQKEKQRISNQYGKCGTDRWIDENGKRWNGKTCPDCFAEAMKNRMKAIRQNKASVCIS